MDDEFMAEGVELSDCLNASRICIISSLSPGMVLCVCVCVGVLGAGPSQG